MIMFHKFTLLCHSIGMEDSLAVLKSDWSRAGLCMDFLVFIYSHAKITCQTRVVFFFNALKIIWRKSKIHRQQYFMHKNIWKLFGFAFRQFSHREVVGLFGKAVKIERSN